MKEIFEAIRDPLIAGIRTGVAAAVGAFVTWLLNLGILVPEGFEVVLNSAVFGLVTMIYNLVVNFLERKVHPGFGYLLAIPRTPSYEQLPAA